MIHRDIAILICSRGRDDVLARLLSDLHGAFLPALAKAGRSATVFVYAQAYSEDYLAGLERTFADAVERLDLVIVTAMRPHARIGDVVHAAIEAMHARATYRLAMLMDDDSTYDADPAVDANLAAAADRFIAQGHRAYSVKLGDNRDLAYGPFVHSVDPIMPFKEKMLWVSREVLDETLEVPRFKELSIGEDAVIAAVAWLDHQDRCFAVYGMGTFLHLGFERPQGDSDEEIAGGYAALMNYDPSSPAEHGKYDAALRTGVTPYHVFPHVFVAEDHPHYIYNGIQPERLRAADR